jgi:hypothetical protein
MIAIFIIAGGYLALRVAHAAINSLAAVPRRNEDMIFY